MKILETRQAPNPRRVRMFLAEKGVTVAFEEHDLMRGALRTPEFAKLNKDQRVPVLVLDDGTAISETMAICRYFEAEHPEPPLFGRGAREQGLIEMWNRRMELGMLSHVAGAFRHLHPAMAKLEVPQIKEWGEACKVKATAALTALNDTLATSRYVAGDAFSVADITALCTIDFMRPSRIARPEGLTHLERWYGEVSSRSSAAA